MKDHNLVRQIEKDGWRTDRIVGSPMRFRHSTKPGTVTVPAGGQVSREVPPGTLHSVLKQAGLK